MVIGLIKDGNIGRNDRDMWAAELVCAVAWRFGAAEVLSTLGTTASHQLAWE